MHLEEIAYGDSLLHRLDPRGKLCLFLIFSVFCIITSSYKVLLWYNIFSVGLLFLTKLPFKLLFKRVLLINFFNLFLWIGLILGDFFNGLYYKSLVLPKPETLKLALMITLKSQALFLGALSLVATTSLPSLTHALIHLKFPSKLILIFFLSYRYFSILHQEYDKLLLGLKARGFQPKTLFSTYKTYAFLLGMLILKSLKKAEDLYRGMLARGYRESIPLLRHFHFQTIDYLFFLLSLIYLITVFYLS